MKYRSPALETALLPQYQISETFMERFLVAIHEEGVPVTRSTNDGKIKLVDNSELVDDVLCYFSENTDHFRAQFAEDLKGKIGPYEFDLFCSTIATEWFDGKRLREEGNSQKLKRSVLEYISKVSGTASVENFVQVNNALDGITPLVAPETIAAILTVNDRLVSHHIEKWKEAHPRNNEFSNDDIYLRRGLALSSLLDTSEPYREWDFINSYSIALSAPEKFSQMALGKIPAMINGDLGLFRGRILFFSPFIPNMDVGQLEFGIIPSEKPLPIGYQGCHAGIHEYLIDPPDYINIVR
jgi:hypothetical protein